MVQYSKRFVVSCALALTSTLLLAVPTRADESQIPGDPKKGYWILLNIPLNGPLLTQKEYFDLWKYWPEPYRSQAEKASEAERRQMALRRYGFQETPDREGPIPQQFTPDSEGRLAMNCLACHGGPVQGQVVRGLGNSLIDLTTFTEDLAKLRNATGETVVSDAPPNVPVSAEQHVRGVNNAWADAIAYLSVRDKDENLTQELQFPKPPESQMDIPVDTPPYWLSKKKTHYYYDAFVGKQHRDIMQFTFDFGISQKQIMEWEKYFVDIYAWINSVEPPKYPGKVDQALAQKGMLIFVTECARCHGTYGPGGSYRQAVVTYDEVGTDPVRLRDFDVDFKKHLGASWVGYYGQTPLTPEPKGYVAPPLDGIWASAPYLHNGSVPTLWHLLNPAERPKVWSRTDDGYDEQKVGLETTAYARVPDDAVTGSQKRRYYDSSLRGLSNQGHQFPAGGLSPGDLEALLEYLKTL